MRVLLCVPPFYRFQSSHNNSIHLGLGYLSAMLRREGHEVAQVNFDYLPTDEYADQKALFNSSHLYKFNVNDFPEGFWYGEILGTIRRFDPDVLGINVFSSSVRQVERIAKMCKELEDKPIPSIVVGGPMPTIAPEYLKDIKGFDKIVVGQAENMIGKIVRDVNKRGRGRVYCVPPEDLDALPFPDRDNYIHYAWRDCYEHINLSPLITSRGCKFNCRGCAHRKMGGSYRFRSATNVVDEMILHHGRNNVKFFRMFDDSFTMDRDRVFELCLQMIERLKGVEWLAETRVDLLDADLLGIMQKAGCIRLKIGIESGSPEMLKWLRKGITIKQVEDGCKTIKDIGIGLTVNVMFGMPNETNSDLQKTIDLCKKIDVDYVTISSYVPYPGSEVFDLVPEERKKEYPYWTHTSRHPVLNDSLDQGLIDDLLSLNDTKKRV